MYGTLDWITRVASHGNDRAGSVVHRLPLSGEEEDWLLLFHRKQCLVGHLGLAGGGLGLDNSAGLPLRHEPARMEEEHTVGGL